MGIPNFFLFKQGPTEADSEVEGIIGCQNRRILQICGPCKKIRRWRRLTVNFKSCLIIIEAVSSSMPPRVEIWKGVLTVR